MPENKYDLTLWNRLDSRARNREFKQTLRAEVRDPLWLLSRQWQMGEFEAEDAGSPVSACAEWDNTRMDKLSLNGQEASRIATTMPLEAEVERIQTEPDVYLRIEMGRHFLRLLRQHMAKKEAIKVAAAFRGRTELHFKNIPDTDKQARYDNGYLLNNEPLLRFLEAGRYGQMLDGKLLFDLLESGTTASTLIDDNNPAIDQTGLDFVAWYKRRYAQPDHVAVDGWKEDRLEYQFSVAAPESAGEETVLHAEEYFQGRLDWYNFDVAANRHPAVPDSLKEDLDEGLLELRQRRHFIPSEIQFPGMPKARWWEFEDQQLNFAAIETGISDSAKMVLTEFAFQYSNDWFMLPFRLPVGSLMHLKQIVVRDNFGQRTRIQHYHQQNETGQAVDPHWAFFKLDRTDTDDLTAQNDQRFLIPPVVAKMQEGKPIESVHFTRDEMANYVWAIEAIIPNGLGRGVDGGEYARIMQEYFQRLADEEIHHDIHPKADIQYQIATTVPENWIPFIPRQQSESDFQNIHFQRAAMPRVLPGFPAKRVRPFTRLLRHGLDSEPRAHYFIREEEIPRAGTIVEASWQRARWHHGKVVLWLGYRKQNGRGESASGLKFDQVV